MIEIHTKLYAVKGVHNLLVIAKLDAAGVQKMNVGPFPLDRT